MTLPPVQNVVGPNEKMEEKTAELTETDVEAALDVQPFALAATEYVPVAADVTFEIVGFCSDEVKPFGPVQVYVAPATVVALSWTVAPEQYGPVFDATGVAGLVLTTTLVEPAAEVQPLTVMVTEYEPASAAAAFARNGFRCDEVKPFGPVQA